MTARDRGFVLVNALVLVAALAGIAVYLLARAETARARVAEARDAAQTTLYLDAFEALAIALLAADRGAGAIDHPGETWAQATYDVPLDRGRVAGGLVDLQGRFNVNWLANPEDTRAQDGFAALLARFGLAPGLAQLIGGFVAPDGPPNRPAYAGQVPAIVPVGGPILMLDQLRAIPDLRGEDLDRLEPYLSALPADVRLNLNTAPAPVLQAMIPGLGSATVEQLLQARRLTPFESTEDFVQQLVTFGGGADLLSEDDQARFGVSSDWFEARITATLDNRERRRVTVFERRPLPQGIRVAYRLTEEP